MHQFADWLSQTPLSLAIQTREWIIPTIQSVHIVFIAVVMGSVFMIELRIWGWAGRDQTVAQTTARFGPWLIGALAVLLVTGAVMVVGEPERELLALSFWLKMTLVAILTIVAGTFQRAVKHRDRASETAIAGRRSISAAAIVVLLIWFGVIVLGRLIAYDYVWGSWSLKG
jgi:small-conductance mechanosensitive channel